MPTEPSLFVPNRVVFELRPRKIPAIRRNHSHPTLLSYLYQNTNQNSRVTSKHNIPNSFPLVSHTNSPFFQNRTTKRHPRGIFPRHTLNVTDCSSRASGPAHQLVAEKAAQTISGRRGKKKKKRADVRPAAAAAYLILVKLQRVLCVRMCVLEKKEQRRERRKIFLGQKAGRRAPD